MTRRPLAAINITPLLDVLLILVAVLLLLAPHFLKPLPIDLPRTSLNGGPTLERMIQVGLDASGTLWLNGIQAPLPQVKAQIIPGQTTVELEASAKAPYGRVAQLIEELRAAQPKQIQLLTQ